LCFGKDSRSCSICGTCALYHWRRSSNHFLYLYIKILNNTLVSTGSYVLTDAQIENMGEVRCSMTSGARRKKRSTTSSTITNFYLVSVTNNGVNFSDSVPVIAYDSSCNTCTTTDTYVFCELRVRIVWLIV
jgi:hypothetical protein